MSAWHRLVHALLLVTALSIFVSPAEAARIGDVIQTDVWDQASRFFTFRDPATRYGLAGSLLLGITCGLLGGFIVVRKMALMGDALSHAVLPGVAAGFLWNMSKDPVAIFVGATVAGLIGTAAVNLIKQTTRLKEDAAIGMVLASFYAVGICMVTMIQKLPTGNKSGIDKFLFGQAAAIGANDLVLMGAVAALSLAAVVALHKEFLLVSFDFEFGRSLGFPMQAIHYGLMLLLAFAVVISLQAVGVVLVSAMLITPAAAAYLLTDRMDRLLGLAAAFGMLAGAAGAFLSFLGNNLPTGPFMVLGVSVVFVAAFLFGPRHGVVSRWIRHGRRAARTGRENTLKAVYHVLEERNFKTEGVTLLELAQRRRETIEEARAEVRDLVRHGLATLDGETVYTTPAGHLRACEVVRNHRLWELFLTNEAHFAADHVHDDAEKIEHVLGENVVVEIERRLKFPKKDPHGKPIPSLQDLSAWGLKPSPGDSASGYRQKA
jgi:manganese/zinc/iron transport system permease protein